MRNSTKWSSGFSCKMLCSLSILGLFPAVANAQDVATSPTEGGVADEFADVSEDIVVTAQKRSESLLSVPLAMSAFKGEALAQAGVTSLQGLTKLVPGLRIDSGYGPEGAPRVNLRGLGNTEYAANATPSVGIYVDEVYLNSTFGQSFQLLDLERVEVLRGPQGTLWGKNTTAGVIHAVSRKPSSETGGYAEIEIGNYGRKTMEGAVGGSIIDDTLSARAAFKVNSYNGYYFNTLLGRSAGGSDSYAARLSLLWTPTSDFDLLLKYEKGHTDHEFAYGHYGLLAGGADSRGADSSGDPFIASTNRFEIAQNDVPRSNVDTDNVTATAHYRFGDGYEITNIASYVKSGANYFQDDDSAPYVYSNSRNSGNATQYSNEIRISSPEDKAFSWILGGYYLHDDLDGDLIFYYPDYGELGFGYNAYFPRFNQKTDSLAGFVNATYDITSQLSVSGGIRVTNEKKKVAVKGGTYLCSDPATWYIISSCALSNTYVDTTVSLSDTVVTWDGNINYQLSPSSLVYARVAKGFRAGTFSVVTFGAGDIPRLKPETLISYEVGIKGRLFDGLVQGGLTGFVYDYQNFQAQTLVGAQSILGSTDLKVKGIEMNVAFRPTEWWTIGGDAAFLDHEYTDYIAPISTALNPTGSVDMSGKPLVKAPKTTLNVYTNINIPLGGEKRLTLRTDWSYSSRAYLRIDAQDENLNPSNGIQADILRDSLTQKPYWLGDVNVTLAWNKSLSFTGYVRNLTDRLYKPTSATYIDTTPIGGGRIAAALVTPVFGAPRTYGLSARLQF